MISDVLSEAVRDIVGYLTSMPGTYPPGDPLTERVKACLWEMEAIRIALDTPPLPEKT
jgi:hypothetical protein